MFMLKSLFAAWPERLESYYGPPAIAKTGNRAAGKQSLSSGNELMSFSR